MYRTTRSTHAVNGLKVSPPSPPLPPPVKLSLLVPDPSCEYSLLRTYVLARKLGFLEKWKTLLLH